MAPTTGNKRTRDDEAEEPDAYDDYPPRYRPPPFCQDCGARSHPGRCRPRCHRCDKKHRGACTAFCRKCTGIGHSWRHCQLFIPHNIWVKQRYGTRTTIQNVNITIPVVDPWPTMTTTDLNAAILSQLDVALNNFHKKAGILIDSQVTMNNVNITTNIMPNERTPPIAPDTSLLERVERVRIGTHAVASNKRPTSSKPAFAQPAYAQPAPTPPLYVRSAFPPPEFSQPVFGQPAFTQHTVKRNNPVEDTPHQGKFSLDPGY